MDVKILKCAKTTAIIIVVFAYAAQAMETVLIFTTIQICILIRIRMISTTCIYQIFIWIHLELTRYFKDGDLDAQ